MTFLTVESLSKSFGVRTLFENITFGLSRGDKTALIAPNGTGKSTLLRILAGEETADEGAVMRQQGLRLGYLAQEPDLPAELTIRELMHSGSSTMVQVIQRYELAMQEQEEHPNEENQAAFQKAMERMEAMQAWDYESRMEQLLGRFGLENLDQPAGTLSGGERKRVALAFVLLDRPDLLILDEPTNHLDIEMIEWLEQELARSTMSLLMVTHDRYFLDRVCTRILELDRGVLYNHEGNYSRYLQSRAEREENERVDRKKTEQLYKKELAWMRRGPKARTSKSKSRIDSFHQLDEKIQEEPTRGELRLEMNMTRLGKKIMEVRGLQKSFGDQEIIRDFSYHFGRGERIGIVGKNGSGKSTFLNLLTGELDADAGTRDVGETLVIGHYRQGGIELDDSMRVIDVITEVAEVVQMADGTRVSASRFLEYFLFTPEMQYTTISRLSGGERRRLALMRVLIQNPNFLILDEPTNDLDLETLRRLESFLSDFPGCLLIVSHDRFFMDRLVDHYFLFRGDGTVDDLHGSWNEIRAAEEKRTRTVSESAETRKRNADPVESSGSTPRQKRLSYKEKLELDELEKKIESLEAEKSKLEKSLGSGSLDEEELKKTTLRYGELETELESASDRWLLLHEKLEEDHAAQ
ncbi:MAG: ABC-F family ATP-binding cassette domain-containing protein [Bacteroidota bacterium]